MNQNQLEKNLRRRGLSAKDHFLRNVIFSNLAKRGANTAGIKDYNKKHETEIEIRQCKYLNNIVEQDHRNIKRRIRLMLGFKSFWTARIVLAGIELVHMLKKGQLKTPKKGASMSFANQFYSLAA